MKKSILFTMCMAVGISAFAQFTPGNLAVYRYGDGTAPLANGVRVPVFVDEYNPTTGLKVNTIAIPATASGGNYGIEGLGLTSTGGFEREGYPVLSRDGATLSVIGHNPATSGQFVVATINAAGAVNAKTLVVDAIGAPRSAVVEGTSVYFNGFDGGVRYKTLETDVASTRVSTGQNSPRVLTITDFVYSNGATSNVRIFAPIGSADNAATKTPLPTASTAFTFINYPGSAKPVSAHQMVCITAGTGTDRRTLLYLLDDNASAPKIWKYRVNNGGSDWLALGSLAVPVNTESLSAKLDANGVKLYFTSYGDGASVASGIYTASDNFTGEGNANITATSYTLLANAPANTTFRGVTMAPGTNVLPVTLHSFEAKKSGAAIRLSWATASEKNSAVFEVLKSEDGKDFRKIGEVAAAGNADSQINYVFNDENPTLGVNYYKLNQLDKNGKATVYGPVQASIAIEKTDFNVNASSSSSTIQLSVYVQAKQQAKISILNIGGQLLQQQSLNLQKGYNSIRIQASGIQTGVQIAVLNAQGQVISKKFVWQ